MFKSNYTDKDYTVKNVTNVKLSKIKLENDWNNPLIKVEYFWIIVARDVITHLFILWYLYERIESDWICTLKWFYETNLLHRNISLKQLKFWLWYKIVLASNDQQLQYLILITLNKVPWNNVISDGQNRLHWIYWIRCKHKRKNAKMFPLFM